MRAAPGRVAHPIVRREVFFLGKQWAGHWLRKSAKNPRNILIYGHSGHFLGWSADHRDQFNPDRSTGHPQPFFGVALDEMPRIS
jgi:hypothetical protein